MRLVADENMVGLEALPEAIDVCAVPGRAIDRSLLADADALWVRSVTRVDDALVRDTPLRFVGSATAGLEHIDASALASRGIGFAAAPGANAMAVVEYVVAALAHAGGPWATLGEGGCLGIVGHGNVGRRLAAFATAMGWRHRICDPPLAAATPAAADYVSFEEILSCDVISLHCALHGDGPHASRHLLDGKALARLSPTQWLINASRGAVVDTAAIRAHLAGLRCANFVFDVWENEPGIDAALTASPAIRLATPHIAGYSWDAKWSATRLLLQAMARQGLIEAGSAQPPVVADGMPRDWPAGATEPRQLLVPVYDIAADDARLRAVLAQPDADDRARGFDRLRRDYPLRREASRLLGDCKDSALDELEGEAGRTARALLAAAQADS